jgi:DNA-binding transcriptional regulator YdaS (Cro superfamily)
MRPEDVWEINQWCSGTDTRPPEVVAEIERERALKRDQYRALRRLHFRFGRRTAAAPEYMANPQNGDQSSGRE